jgi:hypothetical protein
VGLDAFLGQLSKDEQVGTTGVFSQDTRKATKLSAVSPFVFPRGGVYFFHSFIGSSYWDFCGC